MIVFKLVILVVAICLVVAIGFACSHHRIESEELSPNRVDIDGPFPTTPFSPSTTFSYLVPETCQVMIVVYNVAGEIADTLVSKVLAPGPHNIYWNASRIPSGVYFIQSTICGKLTTKKIVMLK
jgi:hypothetical protein